MKKKVLFIIWSFTYGGGAEKILANIVNNLSVDKYEIEILEFLHSDIGKENVNDNIKIHRPIIDSTKKGVFCHIKNKILGKLVFICPGLIRKIYLNKVYDVEISFNYLIPTFLLNKKSNKCISWVHGAIDDLEPKLWLKKLQKKYFDKTDIIVSISTKTEKSILNLYPNLKNKLIKIYNGYDFDKMSLNTEYIEPFELLYCNRLDENKNPFFLVKVAKQLKNKGVNFHLKILGAGELEEGLRNYIIKNKLENEVQLKGYVKNPYGYFNACKIFCLTSYSEGFPTTIVEAMLFGKPFISTPVAGVDELSVNNECGFVENDVNKYADRIIQLFNDKEMYAKMSENCKYEVQKYTLEIQIKAIESVLDD